MSNTIYTSQVVMPMLRRVYPTLMRASDVGVPSGTYPLDENFVKEIEGWSFLSKRRLKHQIPNIQLSLWCLSINKVICTDGKPTHFTSRAFNLMGEEGRNDFMVELGNLADLHGIIKLKKGVIWVKQTTDTRQLNIDPRVMDGLMKRIKALCQAKFTKADFTLELKVE